MKSLKSFISSLVLMSVVIFVGCSDNLTSPTVSYKENESISGIEKGWDTYSTTITIEANQTIWLNSKVTSIAWINSYKISNCNQQSRDFYISSNSLDGIQRLPCNWNTSNNFMLEDLVIQNISGVRKTIEIVITGIGVN